MAGKVVLAYSGGLDTSVAIPWLKEKYKLDVIALCINVGQQADFDELKKRALKIGAIESKVVDARQDFIDGFVFKSLKANALYEGKYPLATALARPLIAYHLVKEAEKSDAGFVAHGCTAKGNDQVRFDVGVKTLNPEIKILAPLREWKMSREQEIAYIEEKGIVLETTKQKPYSIDENLWGRSIEGGDLEDPWNEPKPEVYLWTNRVEWPEDPEFMTLGFEEGKPISINGEKEDSLSLIEIVRKTAGAHGYGRIDMIENRLVGIKSREIYEAPAAMTLTRAHQALEDITLEKDLLHFKERISGKYAETIYNGLWYSPLRESLDAFIDVTQKYVSGSVRCKFFKGCMSIVGRKSANSLYEHSLATYTEKDVFPHKSAVGFIDLWGLSKVNWAKKHKKS